MRQGLGTLGMLDLIVEERRKICQRGLDRRICFEGGWRNEEGAENYTSLYARSPCIENGASVQNCWVISL